MSTGEGENEVYRGAYRHQSLIICLPINFTNFTTHFLASMTVRKGWKRGGWKACGEVKMGCIMTPMPNHLSTLKPHHNRVENTPGRAGEKKRAVRGR